MAKNRDANSKAAANSVVDLNIDDLDQVVGGATTPAAAAAPAPQTTQQLNAVAGFDTSHIDLSAAAMASGAAEHAVANVIAAGQGLQVAPGVSLTQVMEPGAMHLLEAVAPQDNINPAQALASFGAQITQMTAATGHGNDWSMVGAEIAHVMGNNPALAMQGIDAAVNAHNLTGDQAVSLLTSVAANGTQAFQTAAGGEIAALIHNNQITAAQAVSNIDHAVSSNVLSGSQAASLLLGAQASGATLPLTQNLLNAVAGFDTSHIDLSTAAMASGAAEKAAAQVVASADNMAPGAMLGTFLEPGAMHLVEAVAPQDNINQAQALAAFAGQITTLAGHGNDWSMIGAEITHQMGNNPALVMQGVDAAVSAHNLTGDQAVSLLAGIAASGTPALQTAAGGEIAALIHNAQVTAVQAMIDIDRAVSSNALTGDQAVALLLGAAAGGTADVQAAAGVEIASIISTNHIDAGVAIADIRQAVSSGALTGGQAVSMMAGVFANGTTDAQTDAAGGIAALIKGNFVTAADAAAGIVSACTSGAFTIAHSWIGTIANNLDPAVPVANAMHVLEAVAAAGGTAAIQVAIGGEIAAMIGSGVLTPALAAQDIDAAVTANVLTADQAMCVLAGVIATGNASAQSAAAGEIVSLISTNTITAAAAAADIDTAVKTGVLTGDQAVAVLASVAAAGGPALPAAAGEIMSLINGGSVAAANVMTDIGNAVAAHALAGDRAVGLLAGLAGAGTAALQAAAANEIVALINTTSVTAAGAMADINGAVGAQLLTGAQALTVLLDVATNATAGATVQAAAGGEIATLIAGTSISSMTAIQAIDSAFKTKAMTGDQAIVLLAGVMATEVAGAEGPASPQTKAASDAARDAAKEIIAVLGPAPVTATAMADIDNAVKTGALTGGQAVAVLAGIGGIGPVALQTAAAGEMVSLINGNSVTAAAAMATIGAEVASNLIMGNQALTLLADIASNAAAGPAVLVAVGGEMAALMAGGLVPSTAGITTIDGAALHKTMTGDQAAMVLAGIMAHGNAAAQASAAKEIATLINKNLITTAAIVADIDSAVKNSVLSGDQAVSILAGVAANGMAAGTSATQSAIQSAAMNEIVSLINANSVTAANAMADIGTVVTSKMLTGAQALTMLLAVAGDEATVAAAAVNQANASAAAAASQAAAINPFNMGAYMSAAIASAQAQMNAAMVGGMEAKASSAIEGAVGSEIAALIAGGSITAAQAVTSIDAAVTSQALPGDQAVALLTGLAAAAPAALQTAAVGEILSLINNNSVTAANAMTDIARVVTSNAVTVDQAVTVLAALAGVGPAAVQAAAVGEIASLLNGNSVTAAGAMADIGAAVASNVVTGAQGMTTLLAVASNTGAAVEGAAGNEIAVLIGGGSITAAQAVAAIDGAVSSHALSGDQATAVLAGVAAGGTADVLSAAVGEMYALIKANSVTAANAVADIANAINGTQAIAVLASLAATGAIPAILTCAVAEIASLASQNQGTISSQAVAALQGNTQALTALEKAVAGNATAVAELYVSGDAKVLGTLESLVKSGGPAAATAAIAGIEAAAALNHTSADVALLAVDKGMGGNATIEAELTARLANGAAVAGLTDAMHAGNMALDQALVVIDGVAAQVHASAQDIMIQELGVKIGAGEHAADAISTLEAYATAQNVSTDLLLTKLAAVDPNDLVVLDTIAARITAPGTTPSWTGIIANSAVQDIVNQVAIGHLTPAAALQIIDTALQLVQHAPAGLQPPLLPGAIQTQVLLGNLFNWTEGQLGADIADFSRLSLANNLAQFQNALNAQYSVAIGTGQTLAPLVDSVGQALAITALQTGAQLITPANINNPDAQAQIIQGLMTAAQTNNASTDAALALASFGAAGLSPMLNTTMTARLLGGTAEAEVLGLALNGSLTANQGLAILTSEVNALAATNATHSALGFDRDTATALVAAKLDMAAVAVAWSDVVKTDLYDANVAFQVQGALESSHGADIIKGLGAVLGMLDPNDSPTPSTDPAVAQQTQLATTILNNLMPKVLTQQLAALAASSDSVSQDQVQAIAQNNVTNFQNTLQYGKALGKTVEQLDTQAEESKATGAPAHGPGDSGPSYSATLATYTFYGTGATAQAEKSVQASFGAGIVGTADINSGATGSASVTATAVQAAGTAGAMASLSINFANDVQIQAFVEAIATGNVVACGVPPEIQATASAGVAAGIDISQTQSFGLGNGLSGAQTTTVTAEIAAGASGSAGLGVTNTGISFGARAGASLSVAEQTDLKLGPVEISPTVAVYTPGVAGVNGNANIGFDNGSLNVDLSGFLGAEIGGFSFDLSFSVDCNSIPGFAEKAGDWFKGVGGTVEGYADDVSNFITSL